MDNMSMGETERLAGRLITIALKSIPRGGRMKCVRCDSGTMYEQPQIDGDAETKCYACGHSGEPPAAPKLSERGEGKRYQPRMQGQVVKAATTERNRYGGGKRSR